MPKEYKSSTGDLFKVTSEWKNDIFIVAFAFGDHRIILKSPLQKVNKKIYLECFIALFEM